MEIIPFSKIDVPLVKVPINAEIPKIDTPFIVGKTSLGKMEKEVVLTAVTMAAVKAKGWTAINANTFVSLVLSTTWGRVFAGPVMQQLLYMEHDGFVEVDRSDLNNIMITPKQKLVDILSEPKSEIIKLEELE